jgi:ATP-dependent DNA ligase
MRVEQTFEGGRTPGGASRWSQGKEGEWVSVRPELVCEVAYDYLQGPRFRHASTFLRWRDDKKPEDCRFDQLEA